MGSTFGRVSGIAENGSSKKRTRDVHCAGNASNSPGISISVKDVAEVAQFGGVVEGDSGRKIPSRTVTIVCKL